MATCLVMAGGCGQAAGGDGVVNPTGSCGVHTDPAGGSTRIPDCQAPFHREYWVVYLLEGTTTAAYTIPRMDGEPALQPACNDPGDDLHGLVTRYDLCAPAENAEQVAVVNDMAIAEALRLAHFLNQHLKFVSDGTNVTPYPGIADVRDGCALHANTPELQALCDGAQAAFQNDLGFAYSGSAAGELADRLNELYGIPTS